MKPSPIGSRAQNYRTYLLSLAVMLVLPVPLLALRMTDMPKNIQTKVQEPRERAISLKLPLLQPAFHWTFTSREDFLSGKLVLRIIRNSQSSEIVIFENGQFSNGWEAMPLPKTPDRGEIYFGFISTHKYLTAPGDKLELELTVTKDLSGVGGLQTGILPAGKYTSEGTYSGLIDEYDISLLAAKLAEQSKTSADEQESLLNKLRSMYEYKAFLESWADQWPLKITGEKGWLPDEQASAVKAGVEKLDRQAEPPLASTDSVSVVADENSSRKYLWLWVAIPPVVLLVAIFLRRVLSTR